MKTTAVPIRSAALCGLACGAVLAAIGGLAQGSSAATGAGLGAGVAVAVLGFGALAVGVVARSMPAASLLFAMVTYTCQVVAMALVLIGLNRSGLLDGSLDRRWLGMAMIVVVLVWTAAHLRSSMTARIPAFEAHGTTPVPGDGAGSRTPVEGGAR